MTIDIKTIDKLIAVAKAASEKAYCPYSRFPVGAAAMTTTGLIFAGCNIENAAYGSTICAERTSVFSMVAAGHLDLAAIVIYTPTDVPAAPCGACRQVVNEFGPSSRIISVCDGQKRIDTTLAELLPVAFGPKNLIAE